MNAAGRKKIASIMSGIETVCGRAADGKLDPSEFHITELRKTVENWECAVTDLQSEEEEKYENLPEGLQASEKGERFQETADLLGDAATGLRDAVSNCSFPPEADWQDNLLEALQEALEQLEQVE